MRSGLGAHAERSDGGNEEGAEDFVHDDDFRVDKTGTGNTKPMPNILFQKILQLVSACRVAEVTKTVPITQALERQRWPIPMR